MFVSFATKGLLLSKFFSGANISFPYLLPVDGSTCHSERVLATTTSLPHFRLGRRISAE